jgi:hypothetical protein
MPLTPQQIADLETAELERWYRLPSPPPDTRSAVAFGLCLACALLVLIAHAPRGAY